ncbi:hypothetical protein VNO77_34161 [Canavalia gladiata]|uniref:Uncharacterized protein n=1 Tax=Canavalia gladiata TaxID=3824 RepID=A0AAN9KDS6_CANGL
MGCPETEESLSMEKVNNSLLNWASEAGRAALRSEFVIGSGWLLHMETVDPHHGYCRGRYVSKQWTLWNLMQIGFNVELNSMLEGYISKEIWISKTSRRVAILLGTQSLLDLLHETLSLWAIMNIGRMMYLTPKRYARSWPAINFKLNLEHVTSSSDAYESRGGLIAAVWIAMLYQS